MPYLLDLSSGLATLRWYLPSHIPSWASFSHWSPGFKILYIACCVKRCNHDNIANIYWDITLCQACTLITRTLRGSLISQKLLDQALTPNQPACCVTPCQSPKLFAHQFSVGRREYKYQPYVYYQVVIKIMCECFDFFLNSKCHANSLWH